MAIEAENEAVRWNSAFFLCHHWFFGRVCGWSTCVNIAVQLLLLPVNNNFQIVWLHVCWAAIKSNACVGLPSNAFGWSAASTNFGPTLIFRSWSIIFHRILMSSWKFVRKQGISYFQCILKRNDELPLVVTDQTFSKFGRLTFVVRLLLWFL